MCSLAIQSMRKKEATLSLRTRYSIVTFFTHSTQSSSFTESTTSSYTEKGDYDAVQANYSHLLRPTYHNLSEVEPNEEAATRQAEVCAKSRTCRPLPPTVVTHHGSCARNGRVLSLNHRLYSFDRIWDDGASNEQGLHLFYCILDFHAYLCTVTTLTEL